MQQLQMINLVTESTDEEAEQMEQVLVLYTLTLQGSSKRPLSQFWNNHLNLDDNIIQALRYYEVSQNFREAARIHKNYTFLLEKNGEFSVDLRKKVKPESFVTPNCQLQLSLIQFEEESKIAGEHQPYKISIRMHPQQHDVF